MRPARLTSPRKSRYDRTRQQISQVPHAPGFDLRLLRRAPGRNPAHAAAAAAFGRLLAARDWRLVYGAGDVGLMGEVARAAQAAGAETFGVIPVHLIRAEVGKRDLTRYVVTEDMHERKKVMFMNSDAVVVLPGGRAVWTNSSKC